MQSSSTTILIKLRVICYDTYDIKNKYLKIKSCITLCPNDVVITTGDAINKRKVKTKTYKIKRFRIAQPFYFYNGRTISANDHSPNAFTPVRVHL